MNRTMQLIEDLFEQTKSSEKCPYLERDKTGPYCNSGRAKSSEISESRRMVCDTASLQLWCLAGEKRYVRCTAYTGEEKLG